jgi:hypothetical protein
MQARTLARRQQAKALELRAAVDLGRLWHTQGKNEVARTMLAEVYGRFKRRTMMTTPSGRDHRSPFTEGLDTPDLRDARALLHRLS